MAIATLLPEGRQQFSDANGTPLVGGFIYMYVPNTTTLKNTWQDANFGSLNTNPIILDSLGTAAIYGTGQYTMKVTDSLGNVLYTALTQDLLGLLSPQTTTSNGSALVSFLFPGGVARSLYAKLSESIVDVKDWGAVGDGATDDTTAIQNALSYIVSTGGVLYIPTGNYRITSPISATFTGTTDQILTRPSVRGDGSGQSKLLWDGGNTPSLYMMTLQRTDSVDSAGLNAHSLIQGIGFSSINSGKNYFIGGLNLSKWSYLSVEDVYSHRMNVGLNLDQIISSSFRKLVMGNCQFGINSVGSPSSPNSAVYANNANTFIACTIGGNVIGGLLSMDGMITMIGGSVESNGQGGTTGSGYGAKIHNTAALSSPACSFQDVYFENNGTTGNLGSNASTADIWIIHSDTVDNQIYIVNGCNFFQGAANYAPAPVYINRTITTPCNLTFTNNNCEDDGGYTPSASRPYIALTDTSGATGTNTIGVTSFGNYFNQSLQVPGIIAGSSYLGGTPFATVHQKSYTAQTAKTGAQAIANNVDTAITWTSASPNDCGMWNVSNASRLTVPAGVTRIRVSGNVRYELFTTDNVIFHAAIFKNGAIFAGSPYQHLCTNADGSGARLSINLASGILNVVGGDYFELFTLQDSGGSVNTDTTNLGALWLSMEIIE